MGGPAKFAIIGGIIIAITFMLKIKGKPKLKHFAPSEFGIWYPLMSNDLLIKLDKFRELMGSPVIVTSANGGIGRHDSETGTSQHNVDAWGEVRAVDVFPTINGEYITTASQRSIVLKYAKLAGFTGIGLYTDTQPANMLHVDVRETQAVALWSRVDGQYFPINKAFA
jgi:hypothetical protein